MIATGRIARSCPGTWNSWRTPSSTLSVRARRRHADAFASEFGFARAYGDDDGQHGYERLLADDAVDVVYVATPHAQHHEMVLAALNAGKHVLCEKAFTINAREAAELIDVARDKNLFLMEAVWSRFLPSMQRAFEIAASGELGTVQWVTADLGFPAPYSPTARLWARQGRRRRTARHHRLPAAVGTGHPGFPADRQCHGGFNDDGVDAQNALTLGYHHGAQVQLTSSLLAHGPRTATVAGSLGFLQIARLHQQPQGAGGRNRAREARTEHFDVVGPGYTYELREVTRCIQQGLTESPVMPLEDSLNTMRLFDGVRAQLGSATRTMPTDPP